VQINTASTVINGPLSVGTPLDQIVSCPSGTTRAVGGGGRFQGNAFDANVAMINSWPNTNASWEARWIVTIAIPAQQVTTFAYVLCI
jgi:hypothetical protein